MSSMDTVFIDISMAIISIISGFSNSGPLTISMSMMTMKTLNPVFITGSMTITISRLSNSGPLAISITTIMTMSTMETVFIDISLAIISTISRLSNSGPLAISVMTLMTMGTME